MSNLAFRFRFDPDISLAEAEATLQLAILAAETLFGSFATRTTVVWANDPAINVILVDAGTHIGRIVSRIFAAFAHRQFGRCVNVRQVEVIAILT